MPSHVLKIKNIFQNNRIFILLYLRSIDDYSLLDTFDKYQHQYTDGRMIQDEYPVIKRGLDNAIYVVFLGGATSFAGFSGVSQQLCENIPEQLIYCNNLVVIPVDLPHIILPLTTHEIGHAFSLDHAKNRLIANRVDVMYLPLHVISGVTMTLKDFAFSLKDATFLNNSDRLFVQQVEYIDVNVNAVENLVAYYTFDRSLGDNSGNRNHGRVKGITNYVEGIFGNAIAFNNGSYVTVSTSESLHGDFFKADPFTLTLWVYPKIETGYGWIFGGLPRERGANTLFVIEDLGIVSWRGRIDGRWSWGDLCETDAHLFKADTWLHVAVTNDGDKFRIYLDGKVVAETDFQKTDGGNTHYLIGSPITDVENFIGSIDDCAIFSKTLSEDEIKSIMKMGVAEFLQTEDLGIPEDVNGDGYVDISDVLIVRSGMQNSTSYDTDINNDGVTDENDLAIVKLKAVEAIIAAAPRKRKVLFTTWGALKAQ